MPPKLCCCQTTASVSQIASVPLTYYYKWPPLPRSLMMTTQVLRELHDTLVCSPFNTSSQESPQVVWWGVLCWTSFFFAPGKWTLGSYALDLHPINRAIHPPTAISTCAPVKMLRFLSMTLQGPRHGLTLGRVHMTKTLGLFGWQTK